MKLPKELTTVTKTSKILAFIVFITLPFLGFFLGTTYQASLDSASQTSITEPILPKRTPTPIPSQPLDISDTSTWKTYTNEDLKLSFKYPPAYSVLQRDRAIILQKSSVRAFLYLQTSPNPKNLDAKAWLNTLPDQMKIPFTNSYTNTSNYIVGGIQGIKMDKNSSSTLAGYRDYVILIPHNQKIYQFNVGPKTEEYDLSQQILSTFKFLP